MADPTDPAIVAAYTRAFARMGVAVSVTIKRETGFAPGPVTTVTASVMAIVRDYQPDRPSASREGYSSSEVGGLTQGDRLVIVMTSDLQAASFPLPVRKNDRVVINATGDELNVVDVDAYKRAAAGAIELKAAGIA